MLSLFSCVMCAVVFIGVGNVAFSESIDVCFPILLPQHSNKLQCTDCAHYRTISIVRSICLSQICLINAGAVQPVFLSSNNPTPCFGSTVDLICLYPHVMERVNGQLKYTSTTASWRMNKELLFPDDNIFDQRPINQTATRLRVRVDPANFTGDPVSFTCYLSLTSGGEDNVSTVVDPQGSTKFVQAYAEYNRKSI